MLRARGKSLLALLATVRHILLLADYKLKKKAQNLEHDFVILNIES